MVSTSRAVVHHIEAGDSALSAALPLATAGDTLMLTTSGGIYSEPQSLGIEIPNLTIMAAPNLSALPVWTTTGTKMLEVFDTININGIHFDGRDLTSSAIRLRTPSPKSLYVDNCRFSHFLQDAITEQEYVTDAIIVRNSLFHDIAQTAIEFKTPDTCHQLIVENSTFYHIGEKAIHLVSRTLPAEVRLRNLTINNCVIGILIEGIKTGEVTHSIVTDCWSYGIRILPKNSLVKIAHNCTYKNKRAYGETKPGEGCIEIDPYYLAPDQGDFSLSTSSPCLTAGSNSSAIGDLRWTGQASLIADQQNFARSWRPVLGGGFLFVFLTFAVYQLAHWRLRERTEHRTLERTRTELEAHVTERTKALHETNEQLQREIAERRYVEQALRQARDELESIVTERTQELQNTKENLQELDEQLKQSQKLEAIGQLAGGIAHDFNNQLAIIRGYADMVIDQISPNTRIHDQLNHISQAVNRSSQLTGQLLMFSSKQPVEMRALQLNQTISDLQSMFDRLLGEDIAVRLDVQENVWTVFADAGNLDQVLTNLAVNARDAMPAGGVLTIRTRNVELDARESMHWPEAKPGRYVCLCISDTGIGMDAETKAHLFEPFFTTKSPGRGTGLGLSVVYGIVQAHEGWIDVTTELGKGTIFTVYLPAHEGKAEEESQINATKSHDQLQGRGECILLVEDEAALRDMKTQILNTRNYEVIACESLVEALEITQRDDITFDLLLSDVVLPDGRGTDLASKLTQDRPNLPVVLVTGYTDERADWNRAREAGWPILQKPVSVSKLLESIKEALDQKIPVETPKF